MERPSKKNKKGAKRKKSWGQCRWEGKPSEVREAEDDYNKGAEEEGGVARGGCGVSPSSH